MARTKKQLLINFHSSGKTSELPVSQLEYGEIAVRHHSEKPELYVKTDTDKYATFVDSAKTQSMINSAVAAAQTSLEEQINGVATNVEELSGVVKTHIEGMTGTLAGYVTTGALDSYKGEVADDIADAKNEAIGSASAYTDGQISDAKSDLEGKINTASGNIKTTIDALAEEVESVKGDYVTKATYNTYTADTKTAYEKAANDAKEAAIATASAYTDGQIATTKATLEGEIDGVAEDVVELSGVVESFSANVETTLAGYVTTAALNTYKGEVTDDIANAKSEAMVASSAYTDAKVGEVQDNLDETNAALTGLTEEVNALAGEVNTLIGTDANKSARAIAAEEVAKVVAKAPEDFDTLKEIADWIANDTTGSAQMANDITTLKASATSANTRLTKAENDIDAVESNITALSGAVESKYATSAATVAAINVVDDKFGSYATSADTVAAIKVVDDKFGSYATSAATDAAIKAEATARSNADDALSARISSLEALSGTTNSAVQTITVNEDSKVNVSKTGTTVAFDFSEMVIDGGEW